MLAFPIRDDPKDVKSLEVQMILQFLQKSDPARRWIKVLEESASVAGETG